VDPASDIAARAAVGFWSVQADIARRLSIRVNFRVILDAQADAVDLRAGQPSSFRVLASSFQNSAHAVNRSLR
jgi:hypothetical protein